MKELIQSALAMMVGEPVIPTRKPSNKPLKVCQCGTGYNHRGYQCKKCHQENK